KHDCAYKHIIDYTSICCRWTGVHKGVDLLASTNTPQYALEDVTILANRFNGCVKPRRLFQGTYVDPGPGSRFCPDIAGPPVGQQYRHGNSTGWSIKARSIATGRCYYYFHMSHQSPRGENTTVRAGELIGYTGETGHSPGPPHLHLQVSPPNSSNCS